jgi:hypothetical protein
MNSMIHLRPTTPESLVVLLLACFFIPHSAQAVVPAPDGGYPGGNTAEGQDALLSLTSGGYNTAVGWLSLGSTATGNFNTANGAGALFANTADSNTANGAGTLLLNTIGFQNTATGAFALLSNTTGQSNTANGFDALFSNTEGIGNTANGAAALFSNTFGSGNTAIGTGALLSNTIGTGNTAVGLNALSSSTETSDNTALGAGALNSNTSNSNTAVGVRALLSNTTGDQNTANGIDALYSNTDGYGNTAVGAGALGSNASGFYNTAVGTHALVSNDAPHNVAVGAFALSSGAGNDTAVGSLALSFPFVSGGGNTAIGALAGYLSTGGSGNVYIGNGIPGTDGENNTIRIGDTAFGQSGRDACYIAGIYGKPVDPANATAVQIDSNGKLGTFTSSRRFKRDIQPMNNVSEAVLGLKPVTFRYKSDAKNTPCFGLIAEDVAEVNPDLVVRDDEGKPHTVHYDAVNAMLLNEFLKEHKKVEEQEAAIAELKKQLETVVASLKEHDSKIQKVSARIEVTKAVGQTALNNP